MNQEDTIECRCKVCVRRKAINTEYALNTLRAEIDQMYRLLTWGDALLRSISGWPSNHPNEVTEWREDWRITRERIKKLQKNRNARP